MAAFESCNALQGRVIYYIVYGYRYSDDVFNYI